ncbi:hypothetical protein PUG46_04855 [Erwiniaceae bacterium L1_55_4]|nr:hypothetical protein [Erwiniaceae bacterium L1_55_4]
MNEIIIMLEMYNIDTTQEIKGILFIFITLDSSLFQFNKNIWHKTILGKEKVKINPSDIIVNDIIKANNGPLSSNIDGRRPN